MRTQYFNRNLEESKLYDLYPKFIYILNNKYLLKYANQLYLYNICLFIASG